MTGSPLVPTALTLRGTRFAVEYLIGGGAERVRGVVDQLVVEQTIEFPLDLVPDDDIRAHIVGRLERLDPEPGGSGFRARISFAVEVAGGQLPQLLNVVFGNISLVPGVRVVGLDLPAEILDGYPGPRAGLAGLRQRFGREHGPILATALKPMGTPVERLARIAYDLARGGIHLVKDDHSFATQPFCPFRERVAAIAAAVNRANADGGARAVYLPALNVPVQDLPDAVAFALDAGAGGFLVLPGLFGFDTMRWLTEVTPDSTVIMSHPALLGSFVTEPAVGIAHPVLFGTIARLAGADVSIFPNYGGRFSFAPQDCAAIADSCRTPLGNLAPIWPAPAGGMTVERVPELVRFYGEDVCLLIGGGLYRGDVRTQAERMVAAVRDERE